MASSSSSSYPFNEPPFNNGWYAPHPQTQPPSCAYAAKHQHPQMHEHHRHHQQHQALSSSREMRNKAEKMRRDKLNSCISELATLVPMVATSAKRMDKTSILRLSASHLRIYYTLLSSKIEHVNIPSNVDQFVLEELVCEQLGGFMMIITMTGKIVFVSSTVENLLGYLQTDLMGQSIYNITLPMDQEKLSTYIRSTGDLEGSWKKYFSLHFKKAGPRTEAPVYENVKIKALHRPSGKFPKDYNQNTTQTSDAVQIVNPSTELLTLFVRVSRPEPISNRLLEASKDEYVTRHLIDGRIINCDHRISLIAGYMTDEVSGLSAFRFMHRDDVRWVIIALRQMYDRGETHGSSCYRLLSRNGKFIYLRTFGYLEVDDHGTVESFICVNMLVDEPEGLYHIAEMKKRYSARLRTHSPSVESIESTGSVEDPDKVQEAVMHLLTNLPSPNTEECSSPSSHVEPSTKENEDYAAESTSTNYHSKFKTVIKRPPSREASAIVPKRQKTVTQATLPQGSELDEEPIYRPDFLE